MDNTSSITDVSNLTITQKLTRFASQNKYVILGILLFIGVLLYLAYRMYNGHVKKNVKYEEPEAGGNTNIVEVMYFYTNWCPHCKNAKAEWEQFKTIYQGKTIKNMKINCLDINCDEDESTADKYKVEAYPTIKLVKDGTVYEYDAKPNVDTLGQFLNSVL
tara:strand:+ start:8256 stop:8738 length:483 start_codon:yes stop_codon:yes gene_type:complete